MSSKDNIDRAIKLRKENKIKDIDARLDDFYKSVECLNNEIKDMDISYHFNFFKKIDEKLKSSLDHYEFFLNYFNPYLTPAPEKLTVPQHEYNEFKKLILGTFVNWEKRIYNLEDHNIV